MLENWSPSDKLGVLHSPLSMQIYGFYSQIHVSGYHPLVPGIFSIYLEMVYLEITIVSSSNKDYAILGYNK